MLKQMYLKLEPFKFRLTVFGLLSGASLISLALFRLRTLMSGSDDYAFLVWNLFLAWIPLLMAYMASTFAGKKRRFILLAVVPAAILWLLFFPNAPYILTDLIHLRHPRENIPVWFDNLLINWFAWTGVVLGVLSLYLMHNLVRKALGRILGWVFVLSVSALCGVGIYIGRFLRWNSWDLIFHPIQRLNEFIAYALNPSLQSVIFISVFSSLFIFIYISTYTFGLLFQEQAQKIS